MEIIDTLYVIPNYACNLSCPHCELHLKTDTYNENTLLQVLTSIKCDNAVLFGGEPLLYFDRFKKLIKTNKITSISTNLLLLDKKYISLIKKYNLSIATSWNPLRFTKKQENLWLEKLKLLENYDLDCIVLITLTDDLINLDLSKFKSFLSRINTFDSVSGILFEQLIDQNKTKEFYIKVDKWLCNISKNWTYSFNNLILDRLNKWNCDCSNTFTLNPDGKLQKGCPQYTKTIIRNECLICNLASLCRPCILQKECTFPKRLYNEYKNKL